MDVMKSTNSLLLTPRELTLVLEDMEPLKETLCLTPLDESPQQISRSEGQKTHYDTKLVLKKISIQGIFIKPFSE